MNNYLDIYILFCLLKISLKIIKCFFSFFLSVLCKMNPQSLYLHAFLYGRNIETYVGKVFLQSLFRRFFVICYLQFL